MADMICHMVYELLMSILRWFLDTSPYEIKLCLSSLLFRKKNLLLETIARLEVMLGRSDNLNFPLITQFFFVVLFA